jgi:hypothetical protein
MKTNVVMKSNDRTLFGHVVRQQTKTEMLNMADLEDIAENRNKVLGYSIKRVQELIARPENLERIFYIAKNQGFISSDLSEFIDNARNQGVTTYLKKIGLWKTTGARHTKTVWANPYVWMLIALEMSPEIYGAAVSWLTDNLILQRIEAGNLYNELTGALKSLKAPEDGYIRVAKGLNYIVFGRHEPNMRNFASRKELKELENVERELAFAINMGYIATFDKLILAMQIMYQRKYGKTLSK